MAPVIPPLLLSGALPRSLSLRPWGEDIKQRENLSHFIVLYLRELISLSFTRLQSFFHSPILPPYILFLFFQASVVLRLSLYFIKLDVLTVPFEGGSLSENTQRAKDSFKKESENERDSRSWGRSVSLFNLKQRIERWKNCLQISAEDKYLCWNKIPALQLDIAKILLAEFKPSLYFHVSVWVYLKKVAVFMVQPKGHINACKIIACDPLHMITSHVCKHINI